MMTPPRGIIRVSPPTLTIKPPRPASVATSDADSECLDDDSDSPCSFTGEECPDLCGGPKNSCRSWTPPASPFYYTKVGCDEGGIFLLDDRRNFEERQKIELQFTLHDLGERLQRLRETMSPPRFLSRLHDSKNSTPLSPFEESQMSSERFLRSATEDLDKCSSVMTTAKPCPRASDGTLRRRKLSPIQNVSHDSVHDSTKPQERDENIYDIGKLIHTSLQHVQSTNAPPRYLANMSESKAQRLPVKPVTIKDSHKELRHKAPLVRHASPQLHFGNTAYPTPLPSSPESKPRRKRGRDEDFQERSGCKKGRGEDGEWSLTHWRLQNDYS